MVVRYSQLQKQVLSLYKNFMVALGPKSTAKIAPEARPALREAVRTEFRKNVASLKKTDLFRIEALVRQGQRRLEDIQEGRISSISTVTPKYKDSQ
ncbi:unnamed protein product [Dibothriocephalus latus]|uniref:Complex 1 LYR protein domain-containing protein n=1 Tax=Dibothriocephalus latus TaxID=60516 RepID=A0A3P7LTD9_DIBLA|nr:unnamed protein product [Dibothriocephalus latus]